MIFNLKKYVREHPIVFITALLILIILLSIIINYCFYDVMNESHKKNSVSEINALLYFLTGAATLALAIIAWHKLTGIKEQSEAQFLLQIDKRWSSKEILDARKTLHGIYREASQNKEISKDILSEIGKKIIRMSESDKEDEQNKFIELLNFLELMESVGYLCEKGHVKAEDLDSLFGESLEFNFEIFKPYISHKRKKHGKDEFFSKFELLYLDLREKALKEKS